MPRNAFMSYSHADKNFVAALEDAIERIARPVRRSRRVNVFRDESELHIDQPMPDSIRAALASADWMIVVASPAAAQSSWVEREVDQFLQRRPISAILLVLADGRLEWDEQQQRFATDDPPLPPRLRTAYRSEPIWADFTWRRRDTRLALSDPRFRLEIAKVAAPVRDRTPGDLARAHATKPFLRGAAVVTALAALAYGTATVANPFDDTLAACPAPPHPRAGSQLMLEANIATITQPRTTRRTRWSRSATR